MDPVLYFLAVAVFIIATAIFASRRFARSAKREQEKADLNADSRDGSSAATWIGVDESDQL